jgi:hypothetical protein
MPLISAFLYAYNSYICTNRRKGNILLFLKYDVMIDLKYPPNAHMLKGWSPVQQCSEMGLGKVIGSWGFWPHQWFIHWWVIIWWSIRRWWKFKRWDLVRKQGNGSMGAFRRHILFCTLSSYFFTLFASWLSLGEQPPLSSLPSVMLCLAIGPQQWGQVTMYWNLWNCDPKLIFHSLTDFVKAGYTSGLICDCLWPTKYTRSDSVPIPILSFKRFLYALASSWDPCHAIRRNLR